MILAKIDCTKIDKTKLFAGKNGAKYLDIVLMENRDGPDRFGNDYMVVQGVSKEERQRGVKGAILGNAKNFETGHGSSRKPATEKAPAAPGDDGFEPPF